MACEVKILLVFNIVSVALKLASLVCGEPQVPCFFIFGDSIVDNGNNNMLLTAAKADFSPYGVDFGVGPTGRFTNGRNLADIIAEFLGFDKYIPPFATARGEDILKGVNYGSGGAGIRDESGAHMGARISLNMQLENHRIQILRIAILQGNSSFTEEYLSKCLYTVGMGSNDYINNYFMPQYYPTSTLYTPDQYATALIKEYSQQIKTLYKYGARKVGLFGLGDLGCIPFELGMYGTNGSSCVDMIDNAVQLFNIKLNGLVSDLNTNLSDAQFILINQTSSGNSSSYVLNAPCCKVSANIGKGQCVADQAPCSNRSEYVYWDAFHPTETAYMLLASTAYSALSPFYTSPIDIRGPNHGDDYISSV